MERFNIFKHNTTIGELIEYLQQFNQHDTISILNTSECRVEQICIKPKEELSELEQECVDMRKSNDGKKTDLYIL